LIFIFSSIKINIQILKDNKNDEIILEFKLLYGLIKYKVEYPLIEWKVKKKNVAVKVSEEVENNTSSSVVKEKDFGIDYIIEMYRTGRSLFKKYHQPIDYIIENTTWESISWNTEIGLNDAALTGLSTGLIKIIKTNILFFLNSKKVKFKKIDLDSIPNFKSQHIKTSLNCIFSVKIGHIIIAGLKILRLRYLRV
jgi:hypothetical protein